MNANLLNAIRNLISSQGGDILLDSRRVDENLPVFAKKEIAAERGIFIRCLESGLASELRKQSTPEDRLACKKQIAQRLVDAHGFSVPAVKEMFDLIEEAACGSISGKHGYTGGNIPQIPVPQAPPVYTHTPHQTPPQAVSVSILQKVKEIIKAKKIACGVTAGIAAAALAVIVAVTLFYRNTVEVVFDPIIEFHGDAFPVKILALAAKNTASDGSPRMKNDGDYIGDVFGDFGVSLALKSSGPVRLEIEGDRFIKKSTHEANVPANKEVEVFPRISYNYSELEHLIQPGTENVYFRLYKNNKLVQEKMEVIRFHSVNEVPFREISRLDGESVLSYSWLFAAYVNEDDPLIDQILKEALQIARIEKVGVGGASYNFSGYQDSNGDGDTSVEVRLQVYAIWRLLQERGVKYSNITTTSTGNQAIAAQYVRTLQESFGNSQANCVDGTVLFASVLRKLGISPYLILIPGHMFLGYDLDGEGEQTAFLETTMLGNVNLSDYPNYRRTQVSQDSFLAASTSAFNTWETTKNKIFDDSDIEHQIVSVARCRVDGIMPVKRY
jgi:hypothetical protein